MCFKLSLLNKYLCRWQSPVRLLTCRELASSTGLRRKKFLADYELNLDYSWVRRDPNGRREHLVYLNDHTKSPDDVLANLSDFDKKRMRDISEQIDIQVALGKLRVPDKDKITNYDWLQLLSCNSNGTLSKRLYYIATKQLSAESELKKKVEKEQERTNSARTSENSSWDFIRTRIEKPECQEFYDLRLIHEYPYCPSLVFDMSFDKDMNARCHADQANQLKYIFQSNRECAEPFQLHFCNLKRNTQQYYVLNRQLKNQAKDLITSDCPSSFEDCWPYSFTEDCYTSLFPTKDLIYMSPNAKQEMREYDPSKVYIIGGLVDLSGNCVGVTKSKAAVQGIRSLRLPRTVACKSLPLNIFFDIMQEVRLSGSWMEATKHMPKRMLQPKTTKSPTSEPSLLYGQKSSKFDKNVFRA